MRRSYDNEMMDAAEPDPALLQDDLRNLRVMNRFLGGSRGLLYGLRRFLARQRLTSFSLLDVGTGSADLPAAIVRWSRERGVVARVCALESQALTARVAAARSANLPEISVIRCDAAAMPFQGPSFDVVAASQFLHHFTEEKIVQFLRDWATLARRAIIVSDLVRHPLSYYGIYALTRLCTTNTMTIHDAALSVRRALTFQEWRSIFARAAIGPVQLRRLAPFRISAVISLSSGQ
jgi:hypothetical protein